MNIFVIKPLDGKGSAGPLFGGPLELLKGDAVFFHQVMKIASLQADTSGGLGHIPVVFFQGF